MCFNNVSLEILCPISCTIQILESNNQQNVKGTGNTMQAKEVKSSDL